MNCIWILLLLSCCTGNSRSGYNHGNNCEDNCSANNCDEGNYNERSYNSDNCNESNRCDDNCYDARECDNRRENDDRKGRRDTYDNDGSCPCEGNSSSRAGRIVPPRVDFGGYGRDNNYDRRNDSRCETCGCEE